MGVGGILRICWKGFLFPEIISAVIWESAQAQSQKSVRYEQGQGQSQKKQTETRERRWQELREDNWVFPTKVPSVHLQLSGLLANWVLRPDRFEWHRLPHGQHSLQIHNTNPLNIQEMLLWSYLLDSDFPGCIWSKKLSFLLLSSKKWTLGNARLTAAEPCTQAGLLGQAHLTHVGSFAARDPAF
jgi:hypothetical protein